jgi:hypothetical protein
MSVAQHDLMGWRVTLFASMLVMFSLAIQAGAEDVLLTTREPLSVGDDLVVMIEDVDSQQDVVWISLYQEEESVDSAVLSLGEHFLYGDVDIAVRQIYAGGGDDLVALEVSSPVPAGRPLQNASRSPEGALPRSPSMGAFFSVLALMAGTLGRAV